MGIKDLIDKVRGKEKPEPISFEALWRQILIKEDRVMGMLAYYNLPCPEKDREAYEAKVKWAQEMARKEMGELEGEPRPPCPCGCDGVKK
jgi:hypothetical protein